MFKNSFILYDFLHLMFKKHYFLDGLLHLIFNTHYVLHVFLQFATGQIRVYLPEQDIGQKIKGDPDMRANLDMQEVQENRNIRKIRPTFASALLRHILSVLE